MKFAVFSDIHGNIYALEACLKEIEKIKVDGIIWCGDYITDIPRAHEVIAKIRELERQYKTYIVRGNREDYVLNYHKNKSENTLLNVRETYRQLTKEDIEYILSMPEESIISLPNKKSILISHKKKEDVNAFYHIYGHTHQQENQTNILNPGSVGLPVGKGKGTEFAVIEVQKEINAKCYHINYAIEKAIERIENACIFKEEDKWGTALKRLILTGVDFPYAYGVETARLVQQYESEPTPMQMMEIWKQARKNIKLEEE